MNAMHMPTTTGILAAPSARPTPPPIYVGPMSAAFCEHAAAECAAAKAAKRTLKQVAADLGVSRGTLHRAVQAHGRMRQYQVTLQRIGSPTLKVCAVITPNGALAAAVAAYREYPGTLKNLELPGWALMVDEARYALEDVRKESAGRRGA